MRKIITSLSVVAALAALVAGATTAFFSDTETSKGNTFTAGAIDLKIDNTAYYNYKRVASATWQLTDLTIEKFFDLDDLKPGDWEEDTISLHVYDNDAWACVGFNVTKDDDMSCSEPEMDVPDNNCDANEPDGDLFDGELGKEIYSWFWWDDGDNVLETNERIFINGEKALDALNKRWAIADSGTGTGPLLGSHNYYIGKFFCYGKATPVPQDPANPNNNPTIHPGFVCDGGPVGNISQTDSLMADVTFYVEQYRNNKNFLCNPI